MVRNVATKRAKLTAMNTISIRGTMTYPRTENCFAFFLSEFTDEILR
jgi:hypothetical protein